MKFVSIDAWNEAFGQSADAALAFFSSTHPIVRREGDHVRLVLNVTLFEDAMELFAVDPCLVDRSFELDPLFRDADIEPDWLMAFIDLCEELLGYSPVNASGYLALDFFDIREYYGPTFDEDMAEVYDAYPQFLRHMQELKE